MTVRALAGVLPILLLSAFIQPASAQVSGGYRWTMNRPDSHGPISLNNDRTLQAGQFEIGLKFVNDRYKGQGAGTDSVSVSDVLAMFDVAPTLLSVRGVEANVLIGITRHLTLSATGTFTQKKMDYLGGIENEPDLLLYYQTEALGPEDVKVAALYNIYDDGAIRAHVFGGVSIPVGSIDSQDAIPGTNGDAQLPYQQQLGSGTVDVLPGFTVSVQNEKASLGIQWRANIRIGENDRGWALGDLYEADIWAGYKASDWISASLGARYSRWGNVEGFDDELDAFANPANNTLAQAGWRVDLPLGINIIMPEGRFGGHRLGLEFIAPVHQNLDGPQLMRDWSIVAGWSKATSF
jgi:hypothetical protein